MYCQSLKEEFLFLCSLLITSPLAFVYTSKTVKLKNAKNICQTYMDIIKVIYLYMYIVASNLCQASGDPHYRTWDGVRLHYQGLCRHLLAGVCGEAGGLEMWDVR